MLNWNAWYRTVLTCKLYLCKYELFEIELFSYAKHNYFKWNCFSHWNCTYVKLNCFDISSSSWHAISTDIPDPFSPTFSTVHYFQQVYWATSRIYTELLNVGSRWSSCFCSSMWRGPQEYVTYELVPTSPAVSCSLVGVTWIFFVMGSKWPYNCDFVGWCPPGLVQYCSQNSCVNVKFFFSICLVPCSASI